MSFEHSHDGTTAGQRLDGAQKVDVDSVVPRPYSGDRRRVEALRDELKREQKRETPLEESQATLRLWELLIAFGENPSIDDEVLREIQTTVCAIGGDQPTFDPAIPEDDVLDLVISRRLEPTELAKHIWWVYRAADRLLEGEGEERLYVKLLTLAATWLIDRSQMLAAETRNNTLAKLRRGQEESIQNPERRRTALACYYENSKNGMGEREAQIEAARAAGVSDRTVRSYIRSELGNL